MNHDRNAIPAVSDATTDAAVIASIADDIERYGQEIDPSPSTIHVNVLESDQTVAVDSYEQYLPAPNRPRGSSTVTETPSFATLLGFPAHHGAVIFADEIARKLTAVIDFDRWRDHRLVLELRLSEQFQRWAKVSGHLFGQQDFAEFLEDNAADVVDPSAADMMELAQTFHATIDGTFQASHRLSSGQVQFMFSENINARAGTGGQLEVPTSFTIAIPVWRGGDVIELRANLRFRVGQGGLKLGIKLVGLDEIVREAFHDSVDHLRSLITAPVSVDDSSDSTTDLGHTIVFGPAPDRIFALS